MRIITLFLSFIFFTATVHAQYEDDSVTVNDGNGPSKKIYLTDFSLSDKMPDVPGISGIQIINAVSDSSLLGYVQRGMFNRWVQAKPDKPYTAYLQSYVNRRYSPIYKKDGMRLVWVIQELHVNERTFSMSEKGFVHLKAMAFAGNETFKLITQLDTILVRGGMDVTHKHGENIGDALQILLEQSLVKKADGPAYSLSEIREKALQRYQKPALQSKEHVDGIYLTFEEFLNDQPSLQNVTYELSQNVAHFFYTDSSGKKTFLDRFWGLRKNGALLKKHYDVLIPIEQQQNGIVLTNYLPLARRRNNAILLSSVGGGLIGGAIAEATVNTLPVVENIPNIKKKGPLAICVDIETGEFTL